MTLWRFKVKILRSFVIYTIEYDRILLEIFSHAILPTRFAKLGFLAYLLSSSFNMSRQWDSSTESSPSPLYMSDYYFSLTCLLLKECSISQLSSLSVLLALMVSSCSRKLWCTVNRGYFGHFWTSKLVF